MPLKNLKLIITAIIFCSLPAFTQFGGMQKYQVAGVSVEGNETVDAETIITLSGLQPGEEITLPADAKLQSAVRNLWLRRQFSDVDIVVDRLTAVGVFLVIKVQEYPRLSWIEVSNNDEVGRDDIVEAINKVRGDLISRYDIYLAEQAILELYEENGLAFASVEIEMQPTDTTLYEKMLVYVEEGIEFHVRSVQFEGNEYFDDDELASEFSDTQSKSWYMFWKSSKFDKNELESDLELLKSFFKRNGFIDFRIISDSIFYDEETEMVDIIIKIEEGNKVYVRDIQFNGNTVFTEEQLEIRLDFEIGDSYDIEKFELNLLANQEQTDALSLYANSGYLAAQFDKVEKRVGTDSVDILINVYENERYTIGRVDITGNTKTKDKVIRRELYTRPGDYFDRSAVIRSIRALGVLNYFNPEKLQPDIKPSKTDKTAVDITYNVEERSTDTFNASIGFAGSFGLTGALGLTFNNFSITEPLRGGGGQIFNFNWEFGQFSRLQTFSIGFTEPWLLDEPTTVGFNLYDSRINYTYELRRTGFAVNIGRRFKWPDDYFRGDLSFRYQLNNVGTSNALYYRPGENTELTVAQSVSRISLNNTFFPSVGSKFNYSTSFAMGAIGLGTTDYFKNELNLELYNPLFQVEGNDRLVLMMGSRMGYIAGFESDTAISPIELYYMGGNGLSGFGVTPLRGYPDRSIGPDLGGRVLARFQAELRFAMTLDPMPIYVYGFAEAGNVWATLKNADPFELKRSAGMGIQMLMLQIGNIGFSYGYGFDAPEGSDQISGWRFLFHFGQGF